MPSQTSWPGTRARITTKAWPFSRRRRSDEYRKLDTQTHAQGHPPTASACADRTKDCQHC